MLKQLALAAGSSCKRLAQHQQLGNAAAPSLAISRLISSTNSSAAAAGDRGEDVPIASEYGSKGDERARKMGDSVEPKVHGFEVPPGGANAAPDPDSAGRVGGMDMGKVVDAVGGMMHGDRRRTERAVGSMASESPARTAAHSTGQTTSTRWPKSMETTADGERLDADRPHPVPARGEQGAPLSSGYGNHSNTGAVNGGEAPHPMHLPSDAANTGPDMGSGAVPGMGTGGPDGQQYNRLNRPGAPNVEDNMGMSAGTQRDDTNYDNPEGGRDTNSPAGGRQP